jgi:hypothetical protein
MYADCVPGLIPHALNPNSVCPGPSIRSAERRRRDLRAVVANNQERIGVGPILGNTAGRIGAKLLSVNVANLHFYCWALDGQTDWLQTVPASGSG